MSGGFAIIIIGIFMGTSVGMEFFFFALVAGLLAIAGTGLTITGSLKLGGILSIIGGLIGFFTIVGPVCCILGGVMSIRFSGAFLDLASSDELTISNPVLLKKLPPDVVSILEEIIVAYENELYTSCSVMMRKALESAISIKFEEDGKEEKLLKKTLPNRIELARQEGYITSSISQNLKRVKWFGDLGAHDYHIRVLKKDIEDDSRILRVALEYMFYRDRP